MFKVYSKALFVIMLGISIMVRNKWREWVHLKLLSEQDKVVSATQRLGINLTLFVYNDRPSFSYIIKHQRNVQKLKNQTQKFIYFLNF